MNYTPNVLYQINLIDHILIRLGEKPLLNNKDFNIDDNLHFENYVIFILNKEHLPLLKFRISDFDLEIDLDRSCELFCFSIDYIKKNTSEIIELITLILTSILKIEYYGSNYTKFYFLDANKTIIQTFKIITGFYLKLPFNHSVILYPPIYKK